MNRRDALKSLLAAPVAAAAVPAEPQGLTIEQFLNSPEWKEPVLLEQRDPTPKGHEAIILEYQRFDPQYPVEFGLRTFHDPRSVRLGTGTLRMPFIDPEKGIVTKELAYSGRRDAKGRRIFA